MKEEIKNRWVKLLESGEYNLGKNHLYNYNTDCHCAVGVLVEMALDEGVPLNVTREGNLASINGSTTMPNSQNFYEWADTNMTQIDSVAAVNDSKSPQHAIKFIKENL